ncbi:MAG: PQQ-dependent sugar dehydrogenase, partial [Woeseiaceae bacterium]
YTTGQFPHAACVAAIGVLLLAGCSSSGDGDGGFQPPPPPPPPGDPEISTQRAFPNLTFSQPLAMLQLPNDDTRWYVVERQGVIRVFANDPAVVQADVDVFADLTARVDVTGEGGLLGLAFHPDFDANGQVFVSYTSTGTPLVSHVSRFLSTDGGATLDTANETFVMTVIQPRTNHNGGNIAFGPEDGFLYAGWGDGGGAGDPDNNAQNTSNLLGTITRVDVDSAVPYGIPGDNPFVGNNRCLQGSGGAPCPEIWAWGFRNPWRWSFDSLTGELWVGDVGQNMWEEVDRVERGLNYGWRQREGAHCFNPDPGCLTTFEEPVTEYSHAEGNSITGGYVYRGMAIPELEGFYVFGDFGSGRIWAVPSDATPVTAPDELLDTNLRITSFAQDMDGELYAIDIVTGQLHQLIAVP